MTGFQNSNVTLNPISHITINQITDKTLKFIADYFRFYTTKRSFHIRSVNLNPGFKHATFIY